MTGAGQRRRFGWMTWLLIVLALIALALFGVWRWALANNTVVLLDGIDRTFGGTDGTRIALSGAHYGPDPAQRIEVVVPQAASPRPVVVFIHGGGWHSGAPGEYHFIGRTFARAGYVTVLPGYRLNAAGVYPRMLEDSAAALRWVADNVAKYGGDPDRVYLVGHSAGAYNVVMLSLERQWLGRQGLPDSFVKGTVGLAGPYDFYPFTSDSARNAFGHVADPAQTQPVSYARGDAPPLLLVHGSEDETVKPRNSLALATAMTAKGAPTEAVVLDGVGHAGILMKLAAPFDRDSRVRDTVLPFLAAQQARLDAASASIQPADR